MRAGYARSPTSAERRRGRTGGSRVCARHAPFHLRRWPACSPELGRAVAHHPRLTVVAWLVLAVLGYGLAVLGVHGENLFDRLSTGAPSVPGSESARGSPDPRRRRRERPVAHARPAGRRPGGPRGRDRARPRTRRPRRDRRRRLRHRPARPARTASRTRRPRPLVAQDGDGFLVVVELEPDLSGGRRSRPRSTTSRTGSTRCPTTSRPSPPASPGSSAAPRSSSRRSPTRWRPTCAPARRSRCRSRCSSWCSSSAASWPPSMPMAGAIASIAGGLAALLAFSYVLDLDSSVVNVVTVLGLGLSIDWGLLMVSRFREELHRLVDDDGGRRQPTTARRRCGAHRDRAHHGDRRAHGDVLRAHRRDLDRRAARLPAADPARVRRGRASR